LFYCHQANSCRFTYVILLFFVKLRKYAI